MTDFLLDHLQPTCLPDRTLYKPLLALVVMLIIGLSVGVVFGVGATLIFGLHIGLLVMLVVNCWSGLWAVLRAG